MDRERLRSLVLRNEGIRHPFRQTLPVTIVQIARDEHDSEMAAMPKAGGVGDDVSLFFLSFLAFFTAFYTFIF
jgi:hypothetical protein